jgi:exopolyphosphatase / guanosine-5'-triphosphate,3'-diphosphate pyrophosphatase
MIDGNRYAVIDIGSNSVRLVIFAGPLRAPLVMFNEKVMAGLGRTRDGALDQSAMDRTLVALTRFRGLASLYGIEAPRTVATAAVRDASNGQQFLDQITGLGLNVSLLSGEEEAEAAGYGVIAGFDQPDGIVGDLGGGSLELVRISRGVVGQRVSFPLGVLRLPEIRAKGPTALDRHFSDRLNGTSWEKACTGLPFYLVGGSWRALAKFHAQLSNHPLPILHNYMMPPEAAQRIARAVSRIGPEIGRLDAVVSSSRRASMGDAAAMLVAVVHHLNPASLIVSTTGVREGLMYQELPESERMLDPLIVAARTEAQRQGRFAEHGDLLMSWLTPIFPDEHPADTRLRHTACLLGDIGWAANPDFRADRGFDFALHGNWHGIDERGRAMVAQALFTNFGGGNGRPAILGRLASPDDLDKARLWGLGIRLAQRLSGGTAAPIKASSLAADELNLTMSIPAALEGLVGEAVNRRLRQLASAMGKSPKITLE